MDRFEELVAWQRMHALNIAVWKATDHGAARRDFKFRDQIRDASDSAERSVACKLLRSFSDICGHQRPNETPPSGIVANDVV